MTKATNKITQQEAHILHLEMLRKVTGQLAALQQANDTLVEKWRNQARRESVAVIAKVVYAHTANALEAAPKEAPE